VRMDPVYVQAKVEVRSFTQLLLFHFKWL